MRQCYTVIVIFCLSRTLPVGPRAVQDIMSGNHITNYY